MGLFAGLLSCQMSAQNLMSFSGGFTTSNGGSLSWSLGEMAIATFTSPSGGFLTQGFQQPQDKLVLITREQIKLGVKNGLTINEDGINDLFIIDGIAQYPDNEITIFSRWGDKVFHVAGYNNIDLDKVWNGHHQDNDQPLPQGTYYYVLKLLKTDKGPQVLKGSIHILTK